MTERMITMQKLNKRSGSSLFLMEMILSILILALACTACIRIFAAAGTDRRKARELNHIQTLTASAGEILEGWTGNPDDFLSLLPGGIAESGKIYYYYDKEWAICPEEEARDCLSVQLSLSTKKKEAELTFFDASHTILYETVITFPFSQKEAGT